MGERVAHMVTGKMIDYIEFDDDYAIVKTRAPAELAGQTLAEYGVRSRFGVTIVGIKRPKAGFHLRPAGDPGSEGRSADRLRPDRPGREIRGDHLIRKR